MSIYDNPVERQAYQKKYWMKNLDERKAYQKDYYQRNRLKMIESAKARYRNRKEEFKATQRRYRKRHAVEIKVSKALGITILQARAQLQKGR